MTKLKPQLFICLALLLSSLSWAQSADIVYKQKGKSSYELTIQLTDQQGLPIISPQQFIDSENVFFSLIPNSKSERTYFKESDFKNELLGIGLYQNNKPKNVQSIKPVQADGKIVQVIMTYLKSDLTLWNPLIFKKGFMSSGEIQFPETYSDDYEWFNEKYQALLNLEKNQKYEEMLTTSTEILQQVEKSNSVSYMHFYNALTEELPFFAAVTPLNNMMEEYHHVEVQMNSGWNIADLKRLNELESAILKWIEKAKPYSMLKYKKSTELSQLLRNTKEKLSASQASNQDNFVVKKISVIEQGKYDHYQFQLFVDLLYHTILKNSSFKSVSKNIILNFPLKKEEETKLEVDADWKQQFNDLLFALQLKQQNDSAGLLFNKNIINNLYSEIAFQPKPYFEIFSAANSAITGSDLFVELIDESVKKCNNAEEISKMEVMKLCYHPKIEMSESFVDNINNGMKKLSESKWKEADFSFELGIRQNSQFAPAWFFLGYCKFKQGEVFSAQSRIEQALQLTPDYVSPNLFLFNILEEQNDFAKILMMSKGALSMQNVFLYHFWKAKAHFMNKQYTDAIDEIKNGCLPLNPNNVESYFLLGDIYVVLKKIDLARESYLITQQINPFESTLFNEKMSAIAQMK